MASLNTSEKQILEKLLQMGGGYVLNFKDRTFGEFFRDDVGVDIFDQKYNYASGSKANRMRGFWQTADDSLVGKSILKLIEYIENQILLGNLKKEDFTPELVQRAREIGGRIERRLDHEVADLGASKNNVLEKNNEEPTAFISYSWETEEHRLWVRRLAGRLRSQGVKVILDHWHLGIGGDRTHFMENSSVTCEFVIIICTPTYAQKANKREGGVGYEAMVITSQLAKNILQDKFIPVLRTGEFNDSAVPVWLQSKIGVDLRGNPYDEQQYHLLLQALHKAQPTAPPLGPKPVFLTSHVSQKGIMPNAVSALIEGDAPAEVFSAPTAPKAAASSPIAYAWYETKGPSADRIQVYIRTAVESSGTFKFETSTGEYQEGTELEIATKYLTFDLQLREKGYVRMQTFNGSTGGRFNLP